MSIPSNLYAEKIFSEHPSSLWALDDSADYISLLTESERNMANSANWTITNGTAAVSTDDGFIVDSVVIEVAGEEPSELEYSKTATILSKDLVSIAALNSELETFSISSYFMAKSAEIKSIDFGYRTTSDSVDTLINVPITAYNEWGFISETFTIPAKTSQLKIVFKVNYDKSSTPGATYDFMFNGVTFGQRAEEFHRTSLGVSSITLPSSINLPATKAVEATPYGLQGSSGYYLVKNNSLTARNFGVPVVYGADNVTTLYPNEELPSLIVPGFGFLNESGKYYEKTFEAWLRINSGSLTPKRILGPINSDDGLYVQGPFISLKIGNTSESHFVSEWGRPMLIDIRVMNNSASLLINGEQTMSLFYDTEDLNLPTKYSADGKDQDWIGFYAPDECYPIQVDGVAIYSYPVPEIVAKRRFVYGQGVDFPNNINGSYSTTTVAADYQFANYAQNYNYPDLGTWEVGIVENLGVDNRSIHVPDYKLPIVEFNNRTLSQWYSDLEAVQTTEDHYMTLRPNSDWDTVNGYILFDNFNLLNQDVKAFYGTFKRVGNPGEKQTLIKVYSEINSNYFEISITGTSVQYEINYNSVLTTLEDAGHTVSTDKFSVGIDIDSFAAAYGNNLSAFFGDRNLLKIIVAGNRDFSNTFTGQIYSLGFCTAKNLFNMLHHFDTDGTTLQAAEIYGEIPSYGLIARDTLSGFQLDIVSNSSWKDYVPLSYFSKYVKDSENNPYYSMDFLQFNVSYPEPSINADISYTDINGDPAEINAYDTRSSVVRTYITFESLRYKANNLDSNFVVDMPMPSNGVVIPDSNWAKTRYEVVNGAIIYPPSGVDIQSLSIATHIEIKTDGIISNPVKIKSLHLASFAADDVTGKAIGTRFGVPVQPYTKLGVYMDYKRKNPFCSYVGTTPYLYLNKVSGFRLRGDNLGVISRGLSTPINQAKAATFKVGAIQASIRHEDELFPVLPVEAFELESSDAYIKFYIVATDSARKRGRIFGINTTTGQLQSGLNFFLNGKLVKTALINPREWYVLGMQFESKPDFSGYAGAFRITGPLTMNSISHYEYTASQEQQSAKTRLWSGIKTLPTGTADWDYWNEFLWREALFILTTQRTAIDPESIYKIYTGTNKIIMFDDRSLSLSNEKYNIYNDLSWQVRVLSAV